MQRKSKSKGSKKTLPSTKSDVILPNSLLDAWRGAVMALAWQRSEEEVAAGEVVKSLAIADFLEEFQNEITGLWEAYNTDRDELHKFSLTRRRQAIAYMLAMHLPNAARLFGILRRCSLRSDLSSVLRSAPSIKIIDIGAGGGASSLAWLHHLKPLVAKNLTIDIDLIDVSRYLLETAVMQIETLALAQRPTQRHCKIEDLFLPQVLATSDTDTLLIVNMGYVLNEIERNRKAKQVFGQLLHALADRPALLCITEPAKQQPARDMMLLHDELLKFDMSPVYPCPNAKPCPMLLRTRDWCYSELSFQRPKEIAEVDHWLGRDTSRIATTGFIYASRDVAKLLKPKAVEAMQVVVGRPLVKLAKKKVKTTAFKYLVCVDGELQQYDKQQSRHEDILKRGEEFILKKPSSDPQ